MAPTGYHRNPPEVEETFYQALHRKGLSRRDFMEFVGAVAGMLGLEAAFVPRIAEALQAKRKLPLVWLEFQDCAGNTESFLRAAKPSVDEIVLDAISLNYHETIMAAAGHLAEEVLQKTVRESKGGYLAVVEGSIPTADGGVYCTIGGRTALDIAREVCGNALATVAAGTCACFGGIPAAAPTYECRMCGARLSVHGSPLSCPSCGAPLPRLAKESSLKIRSIEVEGS
jgi:hydrogenase small subunit